VVSDGHGENRGWASSRPGPKLCRVGVENMGDEEYDRDCSDGYEYRAYYSSCEDWKEIFEVDQFCYIFVYEL